MPWTFAHPAAILPFRNLRRLQLPVSALISGSIAPDLGYYLGRFDLSSRAHSLWSGVAVSVPIGLFMLIAGRLLGPPACHLLPQPHRRILSYGLKDPLWDSPATALLVLLALAIGAATHILWDSFTHARGFFVMHAPSLQATVLQWSGWSVPLYRLLQHLSTVAGLTLLAIAYASNLRLSASEFLPSPAVEQRWRIRLLAALVSVALVASALHVALRYSSISAEAKVFRFAIAATIAFALLAVGAGFTLRNRQ